MRHAATIPALLIGGILVASCTSILGDFKEPTTTGSGGAGGASSSHHASSHASSGSHGGGGAGGATGGGGAGGCQEDFECPDPVNPCETRLCDHGVCGGEPVEAGLQAPRQIPGDCQQIICDADGASHTVTDNGDKDDGNPCTDDHCGGNGPHHDPRTGASCSIDGGQVCNDQGACVECLDPSDCSSFGQCLNFVCQAPTCGDGLQNQDETDVDCGGPTCPAACANGLDCNDDGDCTSGLCDQGDCRPAHCGNIVKDLDETDIDCGGSCSDCANGKLCASNADCSSGLCQGQICRLATCGNGVLNPPESDIDCGGTSCQHCAAGKACLVNGDCLSNVCLTNLCQ